MTDWRNRIIDHEMVDPKTLAPNALNWRSHPAHQSAATEGSLRTVGWVDELMINLRTGEEWPEGERNVRTLVNGHDRREIAIKSGQEAVPARYVDLNPEEERLVLASFDPITGLAEMDAGALAGLLGRVDMEAVEDDGLAGLLDELATASGAGAEPGEPVDADPDIDRAEELREKWGVEPGDLWQLGEHRLICGDCTDAEVVGRVMDGEKANLLFTSPPYWVGMAYETQQSEAEIDEFIHDCVRTFTDFVSVDYGRIVINTGTAAIHRIEKKRRVEVLPLIFKWQDELRQAGWLARHYRIWAKGGGLARGRVSAKVDAVDQHWESITTFTPEDEDEAQYLATFWSPAGSQRGQEKIGTPWAQQGVWMDVAGDKSAGGVHVAAFPQEIPRRNIMLYTQKADAVFEPFSGSGTTIIACHNLKRRCRAIELDVGYTAVALERFATATNVAPVRVEA